MSVSRGWLRGHRVSSKGLDCQDLWSVAMDHLAWTCARPAPGGHEAPESMMAQIREPVVLWGTKLSGPKQDRPTRVQLFNCPWPDPRLHNRLRVIGRPNVRQRQESLSRATWRICHKSLKGRRREVAMEHWGRQIPVQGLGIKAPGPGMVLWLRSGCHWTHAAPGSQCSSGPWVYTMAEAVPSSLSQD